MTLHKHNMPQLTAPDGRSVHHDGVEKTMHAHPFCTNAIARQRTVITRSPALSGIPTIFFGGGGGVKQIKLRTEGRENGDLGTVAP
jgi:hypothetical protein